MALSDICAELSQQLAAVTEGCQALRCEQDRFVRYVRGCLPDELERRLMILGFWINGQVARLYEEHGLTGHVVVAISERDGVTCCWMQSPLVDRGGLAAQGTTVLEIDEFVAGITRLARDLHEGKWVEAADWLKKYGRSPGLDFEKSTLPRMVP